MITHRIDRINKEFLRLISALLRSEIKNDTASEAVLTEVHTSRDLSFAKVYFTLVNHERLEEVQKALTSASKQLRALMGRSMHLRTIPELHFFYDDSEEKARRMDNLLDRVAALDAGKIHKKQSVGNE